MKIILESPRLLFWELTLLDYDDLCEILQDEETMYAYEHAFSDAEVQAWLDNQLRRYEEHGFGLWAMVDRNTGAFIGQMGLTLQQTDVAQELEIGYLLKRKHWKKGYAMEGAQACRDYAFDVLGADRVVSIIRENNAASIRVAERNGMVPEHTFIKHYMGVDMPHIVFSMGPEDR